jgi:tellurium resistance protein TerD
MTVNLAKGGNINLSKEAPGLTDVVVGLGWDARTTDGAAFDLDASAIACNAGGRIFHEKYFVFYNNTASSNGEITHSGDNRTGDNAGDDEIIEVNLAALPAGVSKVVMAVTIHDADVRGQNFGMVRKCYVRVVDARNGQEIARYDLQEDFSAQTAVLFGELYRHGSDWKFRAIGEGYAAGLRGIVEDFGMQVGA